MTKKKTVTAIKGFDADLKCRGFQYEVGKTYTHEGDVEICESGFHACEGALLDVWNYYGPIDSNGRLSRYASVSVEGVKRDKDSGDSKIVGATITIEAELRLPEFIKSAVQWMIDAAKDNGSKLAASGDWSKLAASGNGSKLAASGDWSKLAASGKNSVIASSGNGTTASGFDGTWISLAEFNSDGECIGFATGCIGKNGLKANTPYRANGGKLVEVKS